MNLQERCPLLHFADLGDERGRLVVIEGGIAIPFEIQSSDEAVVELNRPMTGVYIPRMIWKDMYDFSEDSVLLVLANTHYDETEYIRDYEEYLKEVKK